MSTTSNFKIGVIWNLGSLVILALSGAILNILIGAFYNPEALGIFNQVLAIYTFASMLAVGGINLSALRLIAENPTDQMRAREIVVSSVLLTAFCSSIITLLFWISRSTIGDILDSPGVTVGITWITPGLFFFGINKTFLSIINGFNHMRAYACMQSIRYLNLLVGFLIARHLELPGNALAGVFSFSEIILFIVAGIYLRSEFYGSKIRNWWKWIPTHLHFGIKSAVSGALLELNSKVDVLIIGLFLTDRETGIYSFAAMAFEGFMQFLVVLQNNYNPILSKCITSKDHSGLREAFLKCRKNTYLIALISIPLIIVIYPLGIQLVFSSQPDFLMSWAPFSVLMLGMLVSAGYIPFHTILAMGNKPGWHTIFMSSVLLINLVGNLLFVPLFGMVGSSLGTAISLASASVILIWISKQKLGVRLL